MVSTKDWSKQVKIDILIFFLFALSSKEYIILKSATFEVKEIFGCFAKWCGSGRFAERVGRRGWGVEDDVRHEKICGELGRMSENMSNFTLENKL